MPSTTQHTGMLKKNILSVEAERRHTIGQLAPGFTHELNNPIAYIQSNLTVLSEYAHEASQAQTQKNGANAPLILEEIDDIINDCLYGIDQLSQLVTSIQQYQPRPDSQREKSLIRASSLIDRALKLTWNELKYKAEINKDYQLTSEIYCHPAEMQQVLVAVLLNAAESIEDFAEVSIRAEEREDLVAITIEDQGCGIPSHILDIIGQHRVSSKDYQQHRGTGLLCAHQLIASMQGTLHIQSQEGLGTTVDITVPLAASSAY